MTQRTRTELLAHVNASIARNRRDSAAAAEVRRTQVEEELRTRPDGDYDRAKARAWRDQHEAFIEQLAELERTRRLLASLTDEEYLGQA